MNSANMEYEVIVGLEIHIHVNSATKMFCACALEFAAEPNSRVCPVCLGMPGTLPVMNKRAFESSVLTAMALQCDIASFTKWDRKSYYYPDLPKNYQISQYDLPLSENGCLEIPSGDGMKKIRIRRLHLEEDAGKLLHEGHAHTQVDLNRAGTPLMEIVTEPDLSSPEECRQFGTELRGLVRALGVSDGDMEKGQMRLEPNVNLVIRRGGQEYKTPIAEIKNLGSLRTLERAVAYEVQRQLDAFEETGQTMETGNKSTRGWDDNRQVTFLQREKEEAHDYRYFPDPDLVPVVVDDAYMSQLREEFQRRLPELPAQRRKRFMQEYGMDEVAANTTCADYAASTLFEAAVREHNAPAKVLTNHFVNFWSQQANSRETTIARLEVSAERMAALATMVDEGTVSSTAAAKISELMVGNDEPPMAIAEREKLVQVSDAGELDAIVDDILKANEKAVADAQSPGKKQKKAVGFLLGQVMQKTKGSSNPAVVQKLLNDKLGL